MSKKDVFVQECEKRFISFMLNHPLNLPKNPKGFKPTWITEGQDGLVYEDGLKHGYHLDWMTRDSLKNRDLTKDVEALQRHLQAFLDGEEKDKDSGAHPLAHVRARAGILMDVLLTRKVFDLPQLKGVLEKDE